MPQLPALPAPAHRAQILEWVREHLGRLACDEVRGSDLRGGQAAAESALAGLDITGYAARRSTVLPVPDRGATMLSPYIRHGLLTLPRVWAAVQGAPARDRSKYRDELAWQEYARHVYARLGPRLSAPLRFAPGGASPASPAGSAAPAWVGEPWRPDMACMSATTAELHERGWVVNQARMWLASQYTVRAGGDWRAGEDEMFRHLLDGSRAANRLGWQWTVGAATGRPYGLGRQQVLTRAPQLCAGCALREACPIEQWPDVDPGRPAAAPPQLTSATTDAGPVETLSSGVPQAVWLTAESLGSGPDGDPALAAHPELAAVFVFDEPLLARLRLSAKRLVFLAETLAELAVNRPLEVRLGKVTDELVAVPLATTWGYVPGWKRRAEQLDLVVLHPWPWLRRPGAESVQSYSAWARSARIC